MIYFDNAATTRPNENALDFAKQFNDDFYFNPSALYRAGINVANELKKTKDVILQSLGTTSHEVIFTSCGSEANNLAIFSSVKRGVFVTDEGEHASVYKSFLEKKNLGEKVFFVGLNVDGSVNLSLLFDYVKNNRVDFVSIMHVNNETGAINDVNLIAERLKSINPKLVFHVDGVQAYGKIPYVLSNKIDFYSISAHKINGLKGVGALIKNKKSKLTPHIFGGGQENGYRSGTENVFGIKVFEYAIKYHFENIKKNYSHVKEINDYIKSSLNNENISVLSGQNSSPYILSVSIKGLRGEVIMHALEEENIIVGNGSACSSKNRFSRVLSACGFDDNVLDGVLRLSFSDATTIDEAKIFVEQINDIVKKYKRIIN